MQMMLRYLPLQLVACGPCCILCDGLLMIFSYFNAAKSKLAEILLHIVRNWDDSYNNHPIF